MMKKIYLGILMFLMMVVTLSAVPLKAASPIGTSFDFSINTKVGTNEAVVTDLGSRAYAATVTIDAGSYAGSGHTFVTYIVNNKLESGLPANHDFIVTSDLEVTALYKPDGTIAVAFMDANQDLLSTAFVASEGTVTAPDISGLAKPGYEVSSTPWSGAYNNPTEDTIVWVQYTSTVVETFTLTVNDGSGNGTYNYNEVATVVASGTGNFQHWENEGVIVSLNPTYSFTVVDDTEVTAVFDGVEASPDPNSLFINLIPYSGLRTDYTTYVGQFVLPDGIDMVEFGLLISDYTGGITFDTPGVTKLRSDKYNPDTNEFVRSLIDSTYASKNVRAYMITTDGVDETITFSIQDAWGDSYDDLIASNNQYSVVGNDVTITNTLLGGYGSMEQVYYNLEAPTSDFTFNTDIRIDSSVVVDVNTKYGFILYNSPGNYVEIFIIPDVDGLYTVAKVGGTWDKLWVSEYSFGGTIDFNSFMNLKVEKTRDDINVYVNDVLAFTYTNAAFDGMVMQVGLVGEKTAPIYFDDFSYTAE
jgi:hypothetical protein